MENFLKLCGVILLFLWIIFFISQEYFIKERERKVTLDIIKSQKFAVCVIKKQQFKAVILTVSKRDSIFELSRLSDYLVDAIEVGDSIYKEKGVNCCVIVGKNKRLEVPYITSEYLSENDYVNCK